MIGWIIVIVLLLLLLMMPLGAELSFQRGILRVKLKLGPLKMQIVPGRVDRSAQPEHLPEKHQKKAEKIKKPKDQKKLKLTLQDAFTLLKVVFRALHRFRKHLSIDRLRLYWAAASEDPCDAVVQFGALNAGLSALMPYVHDVLKIREEDLRTSVDFEQTKPQIIAEICATLQLWEILLIANCAVGSVLVWYVKKKKQARAAAKAAEQKGSE